MSLKEKNLVKKIEFYFNHVFNVRNAKIILFTFRKKIFLIFGPLKPIAKRVNFKLKPHILKLLSENLIRSM